MENIRDMLYALTNSPQGHAHDLAMHRGSEKKNQTTPPQTLPASVSMPNVKVNESTIRKTLIF